MNSRALPIPHGRWLLSVTIFVIGVGVLLSAIPDWSGTSRAGEWRPAGTRVTGGWSPVRPVALVRTFGGIDDHSVDTKIGAGHGGRPVHQPRTPEGVPPTTDDRDPGPREDEPAPPLTKTEKYRVASGDRYWTIAQKILGRGERWPEIQKLNPKVTPRLLREGTIIRVPARPGSLVKNARGTDIKPLRQQPASTRPWTHRVKAGESLSEIANDYYTDGDWRRIFEANRSRLKHPNRVEKGTKLVIPRAPGKERRT